MKRLLIVGCGDVATRALPRLAKTYRLSALARSKQDVARLGALGVRTFHADLDDPESLARADLEADCLLHSVPPPGTGSEDSRTIALIGALSRAAERAAMVPQRLVYLGTSGVYGDCGGARVDESRPVAPASARALRRVHAETQLQSYAKASGASLAILRVPGIYAADRLPLERLRRGTPVLREEDDVHTNHIHAEDLGSIILAAFAAREVAGAYNASDDTDMKMGDYFDLVADRHGLPRPRRVSMAEARLNVSPELLSFWSESRRLVNRRIKDELGVTLRYPTVREGVPVMSGVSPHVEADS